MHMIKLYTIWFTQKTAEQFFSLLEKNKVKKIIDTRINNKSQLAWFTKQPDFEFFLDKFCIEYVYEPLFAPTKELLKRYQNKEIDWNEYEVVYNKLLRERKAHMLYSLEKLDNSCLLCSEHLPNQCHRRLLAEYLSSCNDWKIDTIHLF